MNFKNIDEFLKIFIDKPFFEYEKKGKTYFLKNKELEIQKQPIMPGLPLGKQDKFFEPSLYLLELISKKTKNKIFINKEAEWLFLCGRDVFPKNITRNEAKEKIFLIQNEQNENLGLGIKTKHKGKKIIKNLKDRGDFLRREK